MSQEVKNLTVFRFSQVNGLNVIHAALNWIYTL